METIGDFQVGMLNPGEPFHLPGNEDVIFAMIRQTDDLIESIIINQTPRSRIGESLVSIPEQNIIPLDPISCCLYELSPGDRFIYKPAIDESIDSQPEPMLLVVNRRSSSGFIYCDILFPKERTDQPKLLGNTSVLPVP